MSRLKSRNKKSLTKKQEFVRTVLERLKAKTPDPRCELYYRTPFQLLVSVVLSAQTTDKSVNRCMQTLYDKDLEPQTIIAWGEAGLYDKIKTIGLAKTKAKNVFRLSQRILSEHGGKVPATREALEDLPGVGKKTASVVLGELFQEPTLAVDTHVFRVTNRLGLQNESAPEKAETKLLEIIPKEYLPKAHHWFILHGRYTCMARKPDCANCVLNDICPSSLVSTAH